MVTGETVVARGEIALRLPQWFHVFPCHLQRYLKKYPAVGNRAKY